MRYVYQMTAAVAALSFVVYFQVRGQNSQTLSITNYQFVSEQRYSRTQSYVTYRADLVNTGADRGAMTAVVSSLVSSVQTVPTRTNLHFPAVPAGGRVTSLDTFTILVDRTVPFDFANLVWAFAAPVAEAGPNQTVEVGSVVTLAGTGSTNPSGMGALAYKWEFVTRPPGTDPKLYGSDSVIANFKVDAPGNYSLRLTVNNGFASDSANVTVSTTNSPPVANAGPGQTVGVGSTVVLNGGNSSDVDGDPLTYSWKFISRAPGSTALLQNATSVLPSFVVDKKGTYIVGLVVNDGKADSTQSTVQISTQNTPPVANGGPNQPVAVGGIVRLNGSGSTDVDGDALTYRWSFNAVPTGSTAALTNATGVNPTFVADLPGTYVVQLIVNDGQVDSDPTTVSITTNTVQPPTANAGDNQTAQHGELVRLSGTGTDPQGLPLTYHWSITTKPAGSTAELSNFANTLPTFTADKPGDYIVQLIVNNGYVNSAPSTVTITTTNTAPVASAGGDQTVRLGAVVELDGSASSDADGDPLTYSWSLTFRPDGSTATLSAPHSAKPTFIADVPGTYVAQLIVSDGFTNSAPKTVSIAAGLNSIILSPSPLNLPAHSTGSLTVTLGSTAGAGGVVVSLASNDPTVLAVPDNVSVAEGATSATATVTSGVAGMALIIASSPGLTPTSVTANVTLAGMSMALDSSTIGVGGSTKGTITLSDPVPPGGLVVNLSASPAGVVTVPSTVNIPSGNKGTFTVASAGVGTATITASAPTFGNASAAITVSKLGAIHLQPDFMVSVGETKTYPVSLATAAPVGGVTITLTSSSPSTATVSQSVSIAQGNTTPQTPAQITGVAAGNLTITASAPGFDGDAQSVHVGVTLIFTQSTLSVPVGGTANLTLTLGNPPSSNLPITLKSDNPAFATVPASITFPAGANSILVPVTGVAAGHTTIHASTPNMPEATAAVTVTMLGSINLPANATVGIGHSAAFPVSLSSPAPTGGTTVTLTSSDAAKLTISPATVTIAAGQTTPAVQPQVNGVSGGVVQVSAQAVGYTSASTAVTVGSLLAFSPASITLAPGGTQLIGIGLPDMSTTPIVVTLSSDNTGVAAVPGSVTIAANNSGARFTISAVGPGTTKIHASASGYAPAEATVTVESSGSLLVPASTSVSLGQSAAFSVTLPKAVANPVTISLSSSDTSKVTVSPGSVTIAAGQVAPANPPQVTGVGVGSANITASASGYTSATGAVTVTAALTFSPPSISVGVGATQTLSVNLPAVTPTAVNIALTSSNQAVATVPASVTIPANSSKANVTVTGVAPGNATITATGPSGIGSATASVTVGNDITVPATITVAPGQQAALPITLSKPAADTVTLSLTSSDTSVVTLPQAGVVIQAGKTEPNSSARVSGVNFGTATVTVSGAGMASASTTVKVGAALSFPTNPITVAPAVTKTIGVNLSTQTPSNLTVNLSSSNPGIFTVPASVTIPAGQSSVSFQIQGVATGSGTITASTSVATITNATATVNVAPPGTIILPGAFTEAMGATVVYPVMLSTPAPSEGVTITLTASAPLVSFVPLNCLGTPCQPLPAGATQTTVVIPGGQTAPATQPTLRGVSPGTGTITATAAGYVTVAKPFQVTASMAFSPADLTLNTGATVNVSLAFSGPAPPPPTGLTVTLTSANSSVATAPPTFNVFWDGSSVQSISIPIKGQGAGKTTIRASASGMADAVLNVTVVGPVSITTTSLANGTVGLTYNQTLAASGGATPYTWSATGLPAGLSLNTSTGVISGTPTATGTATVNVTVTDSTSPTHQTASASFPVTIAARMTITTDSLPGGITSTPYSASLTETAGTGPFTWSATGLPAGLSLNTSTGAISGTPTAAGTSSVVITLTDSTSPTHQTATKTLSLVIVQKLAVTTTALPDGSANTPYSANLNATGGTGPFTWAASALPPGLALNTSTGAISGTPTAAGTTSMTITVTDSTSPTHQTATANLSITINAGLAITTTSLPGGVVGVAYSATLARSGGTSPFTWSAPGLPAGLTLNTSTGAITGTPTASGTSSVAITVTDSTSPTHQTANKTLSVTIQPALTITTTTLPTGVVGAAYTATLAASGGNPGYTWAASGLPAGLSLNTSTGVISGTPSATGTASVAITVTDSTSPTKLTATKTLSLPVIAGLAITSTALPNGVAGVAYTTTLAVSGGTGPYTWTVTSLPAGLAANSTTGVISGTPSAAGTTNVSISVADSTSPTKLTATKTLPLTIAPALAISTTSLPGGTVGVDYTGAVAATGGNAPLTFTATGLPAGLTMTSAGAISGKPTASGTANVDVSVTDSTSPAVKVTKTLQIVVGPPSPASIVPSSGAGQSTAINTAFAAPLKATVRDASNNPVAGATVVFTAPASGASLSFGASGRTVSVQTDAAGIATSPAMTANATAGSYVVTAATGNLTPASFAMTNTQPTAGVIAVSNTTIGQNLQGGVTVTLPAAAGGSGTLVTLTSADSSKALLGNNGKDTVQVTVPAGQTQVSVVVQALANTGSVNIKAVATGFSDGTGTVTMTPSGFVLAGPNDVGATFTTYAGIPMTITVYSARLDSSGKYVEKQPLRGSFGNVVTVNLTAQNGSVSPSSVAFNPGDSSLGTSFKATNAGSASISVQAPAGFATSTDAGTLNITVLPSGLVLPTGTIVGQNLQVSATIGLNGVAPTGGLTMTVTSSDANKLRFSKSPTTAGTGSITLSLPAGAHSSPEFFIQGVGKTGSVAFTATAPGFGSTDGSVTLAPSGIVFTNATGGVPNPILAATNGSAVDVTVYSAVLDSNGAWVATQQIAGGLSATVNITIGNSALGSVSPTQVTIPAGQAAGVTSFHPGSQEGSTSLTVSVPSGFSTPAAQYISLPVQVKSATILLNIDQVSIGKDLQLQGTVRLNQPAPSGGVTVTLTSNSAQLLLSGSATAVGKNSIQLTVPQGQQTVDYVVQALGNSGNATYSAKAAGYADGNATVFLTHSGVVLSNNGVPFALMNVGTDLPITVGMAQLDAGDVFGSMQDLRAGQSVNVALTSADTGVVTVDSPVSITGGAGPATTTLHPHATGSNVNINVTQPAGFVAATNTVASQQPTSFLAVYVF